MEADPSCLSLHHVKIVQRSVVVLVPKLRSIATAKAFVNEMSEGAVVLCANDRLRLQHWLRSEASEPVLKQGVDPVGYMRQQHEKRQLYFTTKLDQP